MISHLLSARPSYAKLSPVIAECQRCGIDQEVVVCGAALLHRYGSVIGMLTKDFPSVRQVSIYSTYEGATLETSGKETASLFSSLMDYYGQTGPSLVLVVADRHETAAATMAATYLNIPVAHLQGGERSGNIDDRVRDVNSVLAMLHFPSTERAAIRLATLVRPGARVYRTGCPSIDLAKWAMEHLPAIATTEDLGGTGPLLSCRTPFLLMMLHPETEHPEQARDQMDEALAIVERIPLPRIVLWPGQDAGAEASSKRLREYVADHPQATFHLLRGLAPALFLRLLAQASVLVGNSSAGIREASYLGTPVVNLGRRQDWRERGANVLDAAWGDPETCQRLILSQMQHGPYPSSTLYGTGQAARQIVQVLGQPMTEW